MRPIPLVSLPILASLTLSSVARPQSGPADIPTVVFRFDPTYQAVVMREKGSSARDDASWAKRRAEDLTDFYDKEGPRLLRAISDYAGVPWPYPEIEVHVVRNFPTLSIQYPFTLAVGSIRQDQAKQDIPSGDFLILTFAHQITHYLLDPPPAELDSNRPATLDHPLMEEGDYRREALVNLLAYRALTDLWGAQRLAKTLANPLWDSYNPEAAFVDSLRARWDLSRSRPLVSWLRSEPDDGAVVRLADRLESSGSEGGGAEAEPRSAPGRLSDSDFGFDLGQTAEGRLFISFLDAGSPADSVGLRSGDVVRTIEGRQFSSAADAMRAAKDAWSTNGEVNLSVERDGKEVFFQVH